VDYALNNLRGGQLQRVGLSLIPHLVGCEKPIKNNGVQFTFAEFFLPDTIDPSTFTQKAKP
jgi:hypothetical protein